jgi:hypothetical protein
MPADQQLFAENCRLHQKLQLNQTPAAVAINAKLAILDSLEKDRWLSLRRAQRNSEGGKP